jgi:hypothetical protein
MNQAMESPRLSLLRLKKFVSEKLDRKSVLREVLLQEKDVISISEYVSRLPVWLALLKHREDD